MNIQTLRRLLAEALHDANHIDENRLDSQRSQAFLNDCHEKVKSAKRIIAVFIRYEKDN